MTAKIIRFPDVGRPVRPGLTESALIIVLPIIRIERYADVGEFVDLHDAAVQSRKPKVRRRARRRTPTA